MYRIASYGIQLKSIDRLCKRPGKDIYMVSEKIIRPKRNRNGWYDGWFYAAFIDTKQSVFRNKILEITGSGETIIDIGCGTGGLAIELARKSEYVLGIDLSASQINRANKRKSRQRLENVDFIHANAALLARETKENFDRAVFVLMLHEIPADERLSILLEVKKIAKKVTILDYAAAMPLNFWGITIRLIEFLAGWAHYRNFKHYLQNGGLNSLLEKTGYSIEADKTDKWNTFQFITAVPQTNA